VTRGGPDKACPRCHFDIAGRLLQGAVAHGQAGPVHLALATLVADTLPGLPKIVSLDVRELASAGGEAPALFLDTSATRAECE
jgi:hypothetical protein